MAAQARRVHPAMAGQALALGLVLAGVAATALVAVYNLGQVALARTRLTHAADAAAYSAAIVQARSLNILAHVQRTQIAHQVAIAHLVTLGAWAQFSDTQSSRYRAGNPPGYIIGRFFGIQHRQAYAASRAMSADMRSALDHAMAEHQRSSHDVLDTVARRLVIGLPATRDAAIEHVLKANLPGLNVSRADGDVVYRIERDSWPALLESFGRGGSKDAAYLRLAVQRAVSAYGFVGKRNRSAFNVFPSVPYCPWLRHVLRRRGDTRMDKHGRWIAADTQSFHALRGNRYIGCYYREYAMGWAMKRPSSRAPSVDSAPKVPDNFSEEHFWRWARRATRWNLLLAHNRIGNLRGARDAWISDQRGLPRGFDVVRGRQTASIEISLRQAGGSVMTTDGRSAVRPVIGRLVQSVLGEGRGVHASAAAQTYFDSPKSKKRLSRANAWRPYWQARLVPLSRSSRRPGSFRGTGMGGQALIEACLVLVLLGVLWFGVAQVGELTFETQRDDHASRLHAFTADPGQGGSMRLTVLHREPGGVGAAAHDMRKAWRYADRTAVISRVGTRESVVLRNAGARFDDGATQRLLGRSQAAWGMAAKTSIRAGRRIDTQIHPVDRAWSRQAVSFDWLERWANVEVRRRRPSTRREGPLKNCPWDMLLGPGTGTGLDIPVADRSGSGTARARALGRAQALAKQLDALDNLGSPLDDGSNRAEALLWAGVPLAHRTFVQTGELENLVRLAQERLPVLRDLMAGEMGVALAGQDVLDDDLHWLLRWTVDENDRSIRATLSLVDLSAPRLDTRPPQWLPSDAYTGRHDMRATQASAVWCGPEQGQALHARVVTELRERGFESEALGDLLHRSAHEPASWHRAGCRATLLSVAADTSCTGREALWFALQDDMS